MRVLGDIVGLLLVIVGILCTLGGCVVASINPGGYIMLWFGLAMILTGTLLLNVAGKKTCSQCSERVKVKALKCKHCGHDFSAQPQSAAQRQRVEPGESGRLLGS